MGQLWDLIQEHIDSQPYPPSERQIARKLGVSQTTLANWRTPRRLVAKEHLVAIAALTRVPYRRVLDALLADIDYLDEGSGGSGRSAAPMTTRRSKPSTRAEWEDVVARARQLGRVDLAEEAEARLAELEAAVDDAASAGSA